MSERFSGMKANGWAIVGAQGIAVRTISDTRRAAIVNWLVTAGERLITWLHTDEEIERMWRKLRGECDVVEVDITVRQSSSPAKDTQSPP